MSLEENKAIIRRLYEAYNKQNLALFDELYAPDYVNPTLQQQGSEVAKPFAKPKSIVVPCATMHALVSFHSSQ